MNNIEYFDKRVELFLKKKLTQEEELAFIAELKSDKTLLERAKTLALAVYEMGKLRSQRDAVVIKDIASLDEKEYQNVIWANNRLNHFDDLTEQFLDKELTPKEEAEYLGKLEALPIMRRRAKAISRTYIQKEVAYYEVPQLPQEKTEGPAEIESRETPPHPVKSARLWPRIVRYAAAASIIFMMGIGGYKYYQYDQTVSLGVEYYQPMDDIYRSPEDDTIKELSKVFKNVETGENLPDAIAQLTQFYSLAKGEEYSDYSSYTVDIAWNLAIAHLKDNDRKSAIKILKEIVHDNQGKAIADKATELIKKIEKI